MLDTRHCAHDVSLIAIVQVLVTDAPSKKGLFTKKKEDVCSFWFHSSFIEDGELMLTKAELDGAPKKVHGMKFCLHPSKSGGGGSLKHSLINFHSVLQEFELDTFTCSRAFPLMFALLQDKQHSRFKESFCVHMSFENATKDKICEGQDKPFRPGANTGITR
jgi:hypothetical protein